MVTGHVAKPAVRDAHLDVHAGALPSRVQLPMYLHWSQEGVLGIVRPVEKDFLKVWRRRRGIRSANPTIVYSEQDTEEPILYKN